MGLVRAKSGKKVAQLPFVCQYATWRVGHAYGAQIEESPLPRLKYFSIQDS